MDPDFKAISEISSLDDNVRETDLILVSRQTSHGSSLITRNARASQLSSMLAASVSAMLADAISAALTSKLGSAGYSDLSDLEDGHLTSYALKASLPLSAAAPSGHAISALSWDASHNLDIAGTVDLRSLAKQVTGSVLDSLNLSKPLSVDGQRCGVKLADIVGQSKVGEVWTGDVSAFVDVEPKTQHGDTLAVVKLAGGQQKTVELKSGLDLAYVQPTGVDIGKIGNVVLKNGVTVDPVATVGTTLARITNGSSTYEIKSGFDVSALSGMSTGAPIATVGSTVIYNGVDLIRLATSGQAIFSYNGKTFYNGCATVDHTGRTGVKIATVNGQDIWSGVRFEDDASAGTTKAVFPDGSSHAILTGATAATAPVEFVAAATSGEKIAEVKLAGGQTVSLKSGVDVEALRSEFQSKLDVMQQSFAQQIEALRASMDETYLSKKQSISQTVAGPVVFQKQITGKIDSASVADVAKKAQWA